MNYTDTLASYRKVWWFDDEQAAREDGADFTYKEFPETDELNECAMNAILEENAKDFEMFELTVDVSADGAVIAYPEPSYISGNLEKIKIGNPRFMYGKEYVNFFDVSEVTVGDCIGASVADEIGIDLFVDKPDWNDWRQTLELFYDRIDLTREKYGYDENAEMSDEEYDAIIDDALNEVKSLWKEYETKAKHDLKIMDSDALFYSAVDAVDIYVDEHAVEN